MIKLIIGNAIAGSVVFLVGALIHDLTDMNSLGDILAYGGIAYAALSASLLVIPFYKWIRPQMSTVLRDRERSRAYEELLRLKNLLDQKVITSEEFEAKSRELKAKIL